MSGRIANKIITEGLVLYLDAANPNSYPRSGNTWFDLSGYKNDLTLVGSTLPTYSTTYNGSFYFTNGAATASYNTTLGMSQPTLIISCTTGSSSGGTQMVMMRGQAGCCANYGLTNVTKTGFSGVNTSCANGVTGLSAVTSNMNIYAMVWNGTGTDHYRNGQYVGTDTGCYSPSQTAAILTVGAQASFDGVSLGNFYTGSIATIQLYNRALSASEVAQNYNALKDRFGL